MKHLAMMIKEVVDVNCRCEAHGLGAAELPIDNTSGEGGMQWAL
jgi:hypothetical protein